jgi:segregation and condensation protein B
MKEEIDKIRGVDSSHFIRGLLDKKLVQITGRSELPGRPMLYATTKEFLELFGLKDLAAMPPLRELEQMAESAPLRATDETDPRIKEMRRLVGEMKADDTRLLYNPAEDEQFLKDIRERVNAIPTSTPTLDAQREAEKAAKEAGKKPVVSNEEGQLELTEENLAAAELASEAEVGTELPPTADELVAIEQGAEESAALSSDQGAE